MKMYLPGFNINGITLISRYTPYKDRPIGKFICHCGNEFECRLHNVVSGHTKSCGCNTFIGRPRIANNHSHYTVIYGQLKTSCKSRGLHLSISIEEMKNIIHMPCHYCGDIGSNSCKPKRLGSYPPLVYNGIDRVDSSKGYEIGNIVPCCKYCNWGKNISSQEDFYKHIQKTYLHLVKTKQIDEGKEDTEETN